MNTTPTGPVRDGTKRLLREYVLSSIVSLVLVLLLSALARFSWINVFFVPGLLLALVVFPQGGHSDWGRTYLALAMAIDALLFAWPLLWLWRVIRRYRGRLRYKTRGGTP